MNNITELIPSLTEDEKIQLISAASEKILYPGTKRGLRYYGLDSILEVDSDFEALTVDDAKGLIRSIVNHHI